MKLARVRSHPYVLLYVKHVTRPPDDLALKELDRALRPLYASVQFGSTKIRQIYDGRVVVRLGGAANEKAVKTKLAELGYEYRAREVKNSGVLTPLPRRTSISVTRKRPRGKS